MIITKSTVLVGTRDEVDRIIREIRPDVDFVVLVVIWPPSGQALYVPLPSMAICLEAITQRGPFRCRSHVSDGRHGA